MRCSSRSTAWCASTWAAAALAVIVVVAAATAAAAQQPDPDREAAVRLALVDAVRARMGESAVVRLENVQIEGGAPAAGSRLVARPEPGSRVGRAIRFALTLEAWPGEAAPRRPRAGRAVADVFVEVAHVRAALAVAQGSVLGEAEVREGRDDVGVAPLAPLPTLADVVGGRATRALRAGEVLTAAAYRPMPLVKSGDTVRIRVSVGGIEAAGHAVAQQSGHLNERIRLINPESRRLLTGRVTGAGEVEVIYES